MPKKPTLRKNNAPLEHTSWTFDGGPTIKRPKITVKPTGPEIRNVAAVRIK
jgi:hypothetical protein